jgi:hypothetical protein
MVFIVLRINCYILMNLIGRIRWSIQSRHSGKQWQTIARLYVTWQRVDSSKYFLRSVFVNKKNYYGNLVPSWDDLNPNYIGFGV